MHRRSFITMFVGAITAPAFAALGRAETFNDMWQRRVAVGGHLDIIPSGPRPVLPPVVAKSKPKRVRRRRRHRRRK